MIANKSIEFLLPREGNAYPPHHKGDHLEEYFLKYWEAEGKSTRKLIPVHWTAVYNHRSSEGLGPGTPNGNLREELKRYLRSLDQNEKYFLVCTHDDSPSEDLPPNTIVFGAGGNSSRINIPIPLTCGPHEDVEDLVRTIPVSFVGSLTHRIRNYMVQNLQGSPGILISASNWTPDVPKEKTDLFKMITSRSIFSLCPRGYGATSYRLYEAMQLGSIPVYVSDKHLLPWSDEINWDEFCVVVSPDQIRNIPQMTIGGNGTKVKRMQEKLSHVWEKYFTIESTCRLIEKRI